MLRLKRAAGRGGEMQQVRRSTVSRDGLSPTNLAQSSRVAFPRIISVPAALSKHPAAVRRHAPSVSLIQRHGSRRSLLIPMRSPESASVDGWGIRAGGAGGINLCFCGS